MEYRLVYIFIDGWMMLFLFAPGCPPLGSCVTDPGQGVYNALKNNALNPPAIAGLGVVYTRESSMSKNYPDRFSEEMGRAIRAQAGLIADACGRRAYQRRKRWMQRALLETAVAAGMVVGYGAARLLEKPASTCDTVLVVRR